MNTIENINNRVSQTSVTNGWDVLVAYSRDRVNRLFFQQYQNKVATGEMYPAFNHENSTYGLLFKNIIIGPPLISFENSSIADSAVIIRLKLMSGDIIRTDSDGQVRQWEQIAPGHGYALKIRTELKYGSGRVSDNGEISVHFNEGTLMEVEGLNDLPEELLSVLRRFLQTNAMTYSLGKLKRDNTQEKLYPTEFIVRTQRHPNSAVRGATDNTNGAVLLFIKTEYGGKGTLPSDSQPWVIPDGKTAAMFISDTLLFGPLLADNFANRITDFAWKATRTSEGDPCITFTKGFVPTTNVISQRYAGPGFNGTMTSTDANKNQRPARLSMVDFQLGKGSNNKSIVGKFSRPEFTDIFTDSYVVVGGSNLIEIAKDYTFNRTGTFTAIPTLDTDGNVVFNGVPQFSLSSTHKNWLAWVGQNATVKFAQEASSNLNQSGLFTLKDIKTFYIRSVLFPEDNILSFSDVSVPGGLALYGDVAESLTALNVTPQESNIACGQTLQFSARLADGNVPANLTWDVQGVGSIDSRGLYTAPAPGQITRPHTAIVTATTREGAVGSSLMTVLSSPLELMTSFILMREVDNPAPFKFASKVTGTGKVSWSLSSGTGKPGTIDNNGVYTPPSTYDDDNFSVVMAIASLPSGVKKQAIICLWGKGISRAFSAEPAYHLTVAENSTVGFSTRSRDFDANQWDLFPSRGTLSTPQSSRDGSQTVWTCDYKAPNEVTESELVLVKLSQAHKGWQAGYGLIELLPAASVWNRVHSLVSLQIFSGDGSVSDSIYGNGLNQSTVNIKITALDKYGEEVYLPAEDLYPYVKLIDYATGNEISRDNGWNYTQKKNDYNNQAVRARKSMSLPLYVTSTAAGKTKKIAVMVQLTNPEAERAFYSTDLNSDSGMDSGITITTLQPINYSDPQNIIITNNEPVKVKMNMQYSTFDGNSSYIDSYTGSAHRHEVIIAPVASLNTTFRKISISHKPIINETVSYSKQNWMDIKNELSFSCLTTEGLSACSVAGYNKGNQSEGDPLIESSAIVFFDANQNTGKAAPYLNGIIYFQDTNGKNKHRFIVDNFTGTSTTANNGMLKFIGYQFQLPMKSVKSLGWNSSLSEVSVTVTDEYGNTGSFSLNWDDNRHYLTPAISSK